MRRRRPPHVNAPTPCDRGDVRPPGCPASIPGVEVAGGTRARLRVTADGLQALAGRCATLAGELSARSRVGGGVVVAGQRGRGERRACPRGCGRRGCERPNAATAPRWAGRPPVRGPGHRSGRPPWGRYARGGPTDGYVGAAAAVGGAVDELCASERGRRPLAAAGHAVGARLSRGARFDAPTRRHRLGGPGRGPRPLPVDRRRGDDRSRGGPAA